jgi:hypothetical protein
MAIQVTMWMYAAVKRGQIIVGVVIFGVSLGSPSKIITSRCATVSPVITKESYKRCNLKLTDREELAK